MENNEIKKALYKEKPLATLKRRVIRASKNKMTGKIDEPEFYEYTTNISLGEIQFDVPVSDMGEAKFEKEMPAQLLIRWMI